jgi:hypothetical protein
MQNMGRTFRRAATTLTLLSLVVAQGATAKQRGDERGWLQRFERARRHIVTVLSRFNIPPGQELPGRLSIPPGDE